MASTAVEIPALAVPLGSAPALEAAHAPGQSSGRPRPPLPVLVLAGAGAAQAVAVLSAALAVLAQLSATGYRPSGAAIGVGLVAVAGWIVLSVTSGTSLLDRTGRGALLGVAWAEVALVLAIVLASQTTSLLDGRIPRLPAPALALLALAAPVTKLLLADAPTTLNWLALGPRVPERRTDPVQAHRRLCLLTLAAIGLALSAVALLGPTMAATTLGA